MTGRFVISLDFELMWGVRDHLSIADYGDAVLGARRAIPQMLKLFGHYGIRATWASVGMLFARDRAQLLEFLPSLRPEHDGQCQSPYDFIARGLGEDEKADPYHFGRSLLDLVAGTEGQEIATHSFAHFCCLEPGHGPEAFSADLAAARSIMTDAGHNPRSIVFARNQYGDEHIAIAVTRGFDVYRGTQAGFAHRSRPRSQNTGLVRASRLFDSLSPFPRRGNSAPSVTPANVRASHFLRPWMPRASVVSHWELALVRRELKRAARDGTVFHLWWHPHNMGRNTDRNLARLDEVLRTFRDLRDKFGLESRSMGDFAHDVSPAIPAGTK
ncbi:MAG: hypothetical protein KDE55_23400 [Novosphingobium sp.]|nr:hypothetical protein [Novosphingobium sp.]